MKHSSKEKMFAIFYVDYANIPRTAEKSGVDQQSAIKKLTNCKEVKRCLPMEDNPPEELLGEITPISKIFNGL